MTQQRKCPSGTCWCWSLLPPTQNYRGNHISTLAYSKEHCIISGASASETNGTRGTRVTYARGCHMRLGTSHKDIDNRGVQTSAAQFVTGDYRWTSCVSDMCTNLMWNSLYTRRQAHRRCHYVFKKFTTMCISLPVIRRQHKHKLWTLPATCAPYQQSFYVRCIPRWNALTEEAVTASTAEVFQRDAIPVIQSLTL